MSAARRSWLTIGLAATLVLVVIATALAVTDRFTPRERGAIDALQPVADRPDDHIGVVAQLAFEFIHMQFRVDQSG